MYSNNKLIRDVADIAAQIMSGKQPVTEKLHPNQQKLDVHEPEKDELTADDFKKLRGKKEVKKEEVEEILEYETNKDGKFVHNAKAGRYGGSEKPQDPFAGVRGPGQKDLEKIEAEKKKKQKKFSEMVNVYKTGGLKTFMESIPKEDELIDELSKDIAEYTMDVIDAGEYAEVTIGEEASQDEFNAEIKKAQAKSEGKEKAQVAKPFVQAVKQEEIEITDEMIFEMIEEAGIDFESLSDEEFQNVANEAYELIKERQMTDSEMEKKETIVKSMKKGLSGFKERYGDKAKNVMYATATKQAMK